MILTAFGTTDYNDETLANIFRNPREYYNTIIDNFTLRNYTISTDMRPEMVAYNIYGDPQLYWVLLLVNTIIDPFNGWVQDMNDVQERGTTQYEYVGGIDQVDHYVDEMDREWFDVVEYPDGTKNWYSTDKFGNPDRLVYTGVMVPVSVSEHIQNENEKLRTIKIIASKDIQKFVDSINTAIGELND